jgi:hypothetical protein
MTVRYEVVEHPIHGTSINAYYENGFMLSIPAEEGNSDYQRYLRWLENPDAEETQGGIN